MREAGGLECTPRRGRERSGPVSWGRPSARHLDDAVLLRAEAGGLEINEGERSPQREPGGQPVRGRRKRLGASRGRCCSPRRSIGSRSGPVPQRRGPDSTARFFAFRGRDQVKDRIYVLARHLCTAPAQFLTRSAATAGTPPPRLSGDSRRAHETDTPAPSLPVGSVSPAAGAASRRAQASQARQATCSYPRPAVTVPNACATWRRTVRRRPAGTTRSSCLQLIEPEVLARRELTAASGNELPAGVSALPGSGERPLPFSDPAPTRTTRAEQAAPRDHAVSTAPAARP